MSALSVTSIMRMMFGRSLKGRSIAVIGAYFDDSGTDQKSSVVALGGLLGTDEQWDAFVPLWEEKLREPLPGKQPIRQFHASPLRAGDHEFRGYSQAERDQVNHGFRKIIFDCGLVSIATAVDKFAWEDIVVGSVAEQLGGPFDACLFKCIETTLSVCKSRKPGEEVHFFFDDGTKSQSIQIAGLYNQSREKFPEISGFTFVPVSKVPPMQGADMVATETFWYAQECIRNPRNPVTRAHFQDFVEGPLSCGLLFDRPHIIELVSRVHEKTNQ